MTPDADDDSWRSAVVEAAGGPGSPVAAAVRDVVAHDPVTAMVLVEGRSDQAAVEALALRLGRDLRDDGVAVLPIGGAMALGRFLRAVAGRVPPVRLAGLVDRAEVPIVMRQLDRAGQGPLASTDDLEALGFAVCDRDLEDELIRALGEPRVLEILAEHGDLDGFRRFQRQLAQRDRPLGAQLRRFLGIRSGRKVAYGAHLANALDLARLPRPLRRVLAAV